MTRDDDTPDETGERRGDRGPVLELVPGGKAAEPADFIIDKTKKPSVFQLREVTIPPSVAAERAEEIAEGSASATLPRDTERDLESPVSAPPARESTHRDEAEVPAARMPASRGKSRTLWTVLAVALAAVAVTAVVLASGGPSKQADAGAPAATAQATNAPSIASTPARPAATASGPAPVAEPSRETLPEPRPKSKPVDPAKAPEASKTKPTLPPEKNPSPAAPPSAFTTKPPF